MKNARAVLLLVVLVALATSGCTRQIEQQAGGADEKAADILQAVVGDGEQPAADGRRQAVNEFNKGVAFSDRGDFDTATACYDEAIRLDPDFVEAYYNRGNAYLKKDDFDKAIADYSQAIRLDPYHAKAYLNRAVANHKKGNHEKAAADLKRARELDPHVTGN